MVCRKMRQWEVAVGHGSEDDSPSDDSDELLRESDPDEGYDNTDSALPIGQQLINYEDQAALGEHRARLCGDEKLL